MSASTSTSRLVELSTTIAEKTSIINNYLSSKGLPPLSFEPDAPGQLPVAKNDEDGEGQKVRQARTELIAATQELHDLAVGPKESVRYLAWDHNNTLSLHFIYHFKVAEAFRSDEEVTFSELARRTGAPESELKRLLRHAMTNRIFREPRKNHVVHTAASHLLASDLVLASWIGLHCEDLFTPCAKTVDAVVKWPGSQEPSQTALAIAHDTEDNWFRILGKDPAKIKRFGLAMSSFSQGEGFEAENLVADYDWSQFGTEGTIVDVGGSIGFISVAIAKQHPGLKFVVQDIEKVLAGDPSSNIPDELRSRIRFQVWDFLVSAQPVHGADAYFFRWIFHNWSDAYSIRILRNHIPALKPGARIVINDGVLPEPNTMTLHDEKLIRTVDLLMLTVINAREREVDDWKALFKQADERFKWVGAKQSKRMWVIEAMWDPGNPEAGGEKNSDA
ncbi:hypothetical protein LTR04_002473 [Oleoguttula sp. CCFEE 6159]|nr:hypothetical protein LTR04_002473 [Oleoguttula sp. CCFEE 6159]